MKASVLGLAMTTLVAIPGCADQWSSVESSSPTCVIDNGQYPSEHLAKVRPFILTPGEIRKLPENEPLSILLQYAIGRYPMKHFLEGLEDSDVWATLLMNTNDRRVLNWALDRLFREGDRDLILGSMFYFGPHSGRSKAAARELGGNRSLRLFLTDTRLIQSFGMLRVKQSASKVQTAKYLPPLTITTFRVSVQLIDQNCNEVLSKTFEPRKLREHETSSGSLRYNLFARVSVHQICVGLLELKPSLPAALCRDIPADHGGLLLDIKIDGAETRRRPTAADYDAWRAMALLPPLK